MREFNDFIKDCPKCGSFLAAGARIRWREATSHYGDGFAGSHDWFEPECLIVTCPRCDWFYEMKTRDAETAEVSAR